MEAHEVYRSAVERFLKLYLRRELPGWGLVYRGLTGAPSRDHLWKDAGQRTIKDKIHGFELELDIGTWSDRISYFLGRYYDLPTQLLLNRVLRSGDHVFDVGANVGHLSLLMVRRVGRSGRVDAFEPNPRMLERLRRSVEQNGIHNLFLHGYGLSTEDGELDLFVPKSSPGETTFTPSPYPISEIDIVRAQVKKGDAVARDVGALALVKIDVEGWECKVIDGLSDAIERHRPLVITEVVVDHLARGGESAESLFERMIGHRYQALRLAIRRAALTQDLVLEPVKPDQIHDADVVWFDPSNRDHAARLESMI